MIDYGTRSGTDISTRNKAESVVERVYLSVEHLCIAPGDVRKRLEVAVGILLPLRPSDFPEDMQNDFNWIIEQCTKYESEDPQRWGRVEATMKRIKNSTGERIAKNIFSMYSRLQNIRGFPLCEYRNPKD